MSFVADPLAGILIHFQRFTGAVCNADGKQSNRFQSNAFRVNDRYKQNVYSEFCLSVQTQQLHESSLGDNRRAHKTTCDRGCT